jgi:hypothetical protein
MMGRQFFTQQNELNQKKRRLAFMPQTAVICVINATNAVQRAFVAIPFEEQP